MDLFKDERVEDVVSAALRSTRPEFLPSLIHTSPRR